MKQWIINIITGRFKRHESYHDKWNRTYFSKEVI